MPERKVSYQRLEGSQTGLLLRAPTLERLFIDAGLALTDSWVKQEFLSDGEKRTCQLKAGDFRALMREWLNQLITLAKTEKFLAKRIVFEKFNAQSLSATLFGQKHDPPKHGHFASPPLLTEKQVIAEMITEGPNNFLLKVITG